MLPHYLVKTPKKCLLLSLSVFLNGEYLAKSQGRRWLYRALCEPGHLINKKTKKVHETTTFLIVTMANIHRFKKITDRISNKPFLMWLLRTQPLLKYVATLSCNLSLIACFLTLVFSQGSVATYAKSDGMFNNLFTANLPRNLPVKKCKPVKI